MQGFTRIRSPGAPVLTSPDSHPNARAPCAMHGPSLPLPPAYLGPGGPTRPGARWHLAIPQSVPHDALRTPLASPSRRPVAPPPTVMKPLAGCQRKTRGRRCSHPSTLRDRTRQHASQLGTCAARRRASRTVARRRPCSSTACKHTREATSAVGEHNSNACGGLAAAPTAVCGAM